MAHQAVPHQLPLLNHPMYVGEDVDDARQVLSRLFQDVSVAPVDTRALFRAQVNGVQLPKSSVCYCRYENGCGVVTTGPLSFHTIQWTWAGAVGFDIRGDVVAGDTRKGVVLSAGRRVGVHHGQDNGVLSLIVDDQVLRDVVSAWTGHAKSPPIRFASRFDPADPRIASFLSLVATLVDELNRPGGILEEPVAIASFENAMLTAMLFGFEHNLSDALRQPCAAAGSTQVRQVESYIEAHAAEPLDMSTLAEVTGCSVSSIYRAFRRHRATTPMKFLLDVRMSLARQCLLEPQQPSGSVTSIAMQCGFMHLGRFALEYKRRFGESPSQTLARRGGGSAPS